MLEAPRGTRDGSRAPGARCRYHAASSMPDGWTRCTDRCRGQSTARARDPARAIGWGARWRVKAHSGGSRCADGSASHHCSTSSNGPSGVMGATAYPLANTCQPCGRCHTSGTRMWLSARISASSLLRLVGLM
jgi:hypothetical protein